MSRARTSVPKSDGLGAARPMVLSALRNARNTPLAPSSSATMPSAPASRPCGWSHADSTIAWIQRAASGPTMPWISSTMWPRAASGPNTAPATAIATTSSGATANIV